jgi:tRNA(Arg) A34 adenosine deaminase TadA
LHAEVVALTRAQLELGSFTLAGIPRTLFSSCAPCAMCLGAVHWSGVRRLVYAACREDAEALGFDEGPVYERSYEHLAANGIEIVSGLMRADAVAALRDYAAAGGEIYNGAPEPEPAA